MEKMWIMIFLLRIEIMILWHDFFHKMFIALMNLNKTKKKKHCSMAGAYYYASAKAMFFCFVQVLSLDEKWFLQE